MSHPLVVHSKKTPYDIYIGRDNFGNPLGNPFSHKPDSLAKHLVPTREEAIARFETYALERIAEDPKFHKLIMGCHGWRLGCWCAPDPCHGEVIIKLAAELIATTPLKVIVAGSRTIRDYELVNKAIQDSGFQIDEVVSGMAEGVDRHGWNWAGERGLKRTPFYADWTNFGESAGKLRNTRMANYGEALIAVTTGSPGTKHMINCARFKKLPVHIVEVNQ